MGARSGIRIQEHRRVSTQTAYAIIETGGKQYRVKPGQSYKFEKLDAEPGELVKFDKVIMKSDGSKTEVGAPYLKHTVTGEVVSQDRDKKIIIFKMRRRKTYRRTQGHRQYITEVKIKEV